MKKRRGFHRSDRVAQQIHEMVARLFVTELNDPRLEPVEITDVDLSPDLRNARIFYILRKDEEPPENFGDVLDGVTGFIQKKLGKQLSLKYVPEVEFRFDESLEKGKRIDDILAKMRED